MAILKKKSFHENIIIGAGIVLHMLITDGWTKKNLVASLQAFNRAQ
jgi:hypothetical protein